MKVTKEHLRNIIKEEIENMSVLNSDVELTEEDVNEIVRKMGKISPRVIIVGNFTPSYNEDGKLKTIENSKSKAFIKIRDDDVYAWCDKWGNKLKYGNIK